MGGKGWRSEPGLELQPASNGSIPPAARLSLLADSSPAAVTNCLGTYNVVQGKLVNEHPLWQHATRPQLFLAFFWDSVVCAERGLSRFGPGAVVLGGPAVPCA